MPRSAINLYSVRELDEPMADVLDRVAAAGYDGVQFSGGLRDATPAEAAAKLDEHGLDPAPVHVGAEDLEEDLAATLETYRDTIGCGGAVISSLPGEAFETAEAVDATADRLTDLAATLDDEDWSLGYHNHDREFDDVGRETALARFLDHSEGVGVELDVGWALVGGTDPVEFIERYGDRIDVLHMKDMDVDAGPRGDYRELGEGDVDLQAVTDAGRAAGVEWFIYEHDMPEDPAASIDTGGKVLADLLD
jgi:sugar phosphate isomerase/epimerase